MRGLIIAAPASGNGKTTITLGLLRALTSAGHAVRGAKSGPDYIDPAYHAAACGKPCFNLDAWAMSLANLHRRADGEDTLIIEGAMGLFDGAPPQGKGATADLARHFNLPVVLVVDAARMAQSIAPLVAGFKNHDPTVRIAGLILNNVGSPRHDVMLRDALKLLGLPILGAVPRSSALARPSRHLGLVQAREDPALQTFLDRAGAIITEHIDLDHLLSLAVNKIPGPAKAPPPPPAQRIAIATDAAFSFTYPHQLSDWVAAGAEIAVFSPLANDPVPQADLIYLPGGYPELHAAEIAKATTFLTSLRAASTTTDIYGECGGYMVLGDVLIDAAGTTHQMAGLLDLTTSFAARKLHLGYRKLTAGAGPFKGAWNGHEYHYASTVQATGEPLFSATDAADTQLAPMGLRKGRVQGSFAHLIDRS